MLPGDGGNAATVSPPSLFHPSSSPGLFFSSLPPRQKLWPWPCHRVPVSPACSPPFTPSFCADPITINFKLKKKRNEWVMVFSLHLSRYCLTQMSIAFCFYFPLIFVLCVPEPCISISVMLFKSHFVIVVNPDLFPFGSSCGKE